MDEYKEQENNPINPENNEPNQDVPDFMTDSGEDTQDKPDVFQVPEQPAGSDVPESQKPYIPNDPAVQTPGSDTENPAPGIKSEVVLEQPTVQGQPAAAFPVAGAGQTQAAAQAPTEEIPTHLFPAILSTVCCCMPLGVVAIVCAAMVNSKLAAGDIEGAWKMSRMARTFAYISIAIGIIAVIIYFILGALGFFIPVSVQSM